MNWNKCGGGYGPEQGTMPISVMMK